MKARTTSAFSLGIALTVTGCYTTSNVATFTPLQTNYPVSASPEYVAQDGQIVAPNQYQVTAPFQFNEVVDGEVHANTSTRLALEPQLNDLVAKSQGDAVTNLKIQAVNYDHGSHASAGSWKILGWTFGITGASVAVLGAAIGDRNDSSAHSSGLLLGGGIIAGLGVLSYVIGSTLKDPAEWQFQVSGQVVRRTAQATPSAAPLTPPMSSAPPLAPSAPLPPAPTASPAPSGGPPPVNFPPPPPPRH